MEEEKKKKSERTILKCATCGFKYYEDDAHKCNAFIDPKFIGVVNVEEKDKEEEAEKRTEAVLPIPKVEKKGFTKTRKESFKMEW